MRETEGRFAGTGGLELHWRSWRGESAPRGVVAIVHGVGEHCGRYTAVVGPLAEAGYVVYGFDQRGHGTSPGPRVHIDSWSQYHDDLAAYLRLIAGREPGLPVVLYGHSMGSLVVLEYLMGRPAGIAGAIISGVALEPAGVGSPLLITMAKVLTGLAPRMAVDLHIDPTSLTSDPEMLAAARNDPMLTSKATVRWGTESMQVLERVKEGLARIDVPLLVLHGGADALNLPSGAQALVDAAGSTDKTLHVYPGVCHEPHNDLGRERVVGDILAWLPHVTEVGTARTAEG